MKTPRLPALAAMLLFLSFTPIEAQDEPKKLPPEQWPLQERINHAVEQGLTWLKKQPGADGLYPGRFGTAGASTLALYTLAASGVPADDPVVKKTTEALLKLSVERGSVQELMSGKAALRMTYTHSLLVLALTTLDAEKHRKVIGRSVQVLIRAQQTSGQWAYIVSMGGPLDGGDNSNTQFALLALRHAVLHGHKVPSNVWKRSLAHFRKTIGETGAYGYGCEGSLSGTYGSKGRPPCRPRNTNGERIQNLRGPDGAGPSEGEASG